jgi:Ni,Fe-hydrogenase I large subunit
MTEGPTGRTHEPSLRELTIDLDRIKELLVEKVDGIKDIIDERDRRYEERFRAMDEKTTLALASSEKAVTKAEVASDKRFESINEFRGTLSDQAAMLMPRAEVEIKFAAIDERLLDIKKEIADLRESRSEGSGKEKASQHNLTALLSVLALLIALASLALRGFGK